MASPLSRNNACHITTDGSSSRLPPTILGLMWFEAVGESVVLIDAALTILVVHENRDNEKQIRTIAHAAILRSSPAIQVPKSFLRFLQFQKSKNDKRNQTNTVFTRRVKATKTFNLKSGAGTKIDLGRESRPYFFDTLARIVLFPMPTRLILS